MSVSSLGQAESEDARERRTRLDCRRRPGRHAAALRAIFGVILLLASGALVAPGARAVLIAGPDGEINTTAPAPDPGFDHVGVINGLSGVYLGRGWVLTASHVGMGTFVLGGVSYAPIPGSLIRLNNDGGGNDPDLVLFKLFERPPLPELGLASGPPASNESVVLVGNGRNRGAAIVWNSTDGWEYGAGRTLRWGTNRIDDIGVDIDIGLGSGPSTTRSFIMEFDSLRGPSADDPEAVAVPGDSGGAAFAWRSGGPELIGLLFAQSLFLEQPAQTAVFGNASLAADVWVYRDQILAARSLSDCSDGLDNDGDGLIDHPGDAGCLDPADPSELDPAIECDNGIDDDGDGLVDWPEDAGCEDVTDPSEVPEPGLGLGLAIGAAWVSLLGRRGPQLRRFQRPRHIESAITCG